MTVQTVVKTGSVTGPDMTEYEARFEAWGYGDGQFTGIEVILPDSRIALLALDASDNRLRLIITDPEGTGEQEIFDL